MIGYLKGRLLQRQPPFLLLDVNGVGYEIEAPMSTIYELPNETEAVEVALYIHLLVREDAQLLYGFSDREQRQLFRSLLKISGVGPRVALAILSTLTTDEFIACIRREDALSLIQVPGIGKKTAQRMIIDMRDRIDAMGDAGLSAASSSKPDDPEHPVRDAIGALLALGYKPAEASRAVQSVRSAGEKRDDLIRNALQRLTKR